MATIHVSEPEAAHDLAALLARVEGEQAAMGVAIAFEDLVIGATPCISVSM